MPTFKMVKVGRHHIRALAMKLGGKNLVVLAGKRGYVMCGYLNLAAANRFKDIAIKVTGVATVADALSAKVNSCTREARRAGIRPGQRVRAVIKEIA